MLMRPLPVTILFRQLLPAVVTILIAAPNAMADPPPSPGYLSQVRPILANNCFACHGADEGSREANLRLDIPTDSAAADTPSARAIVAGQPGQSELIKRIESADADLKMPPLDSGHSLTASQIRILKDWIAAGAIYETHWSFVKPERPNVAIDNRDVWSRSSIDRLILKTLRQHQLTPQPDADPYALIRRVCLDLTGLPPSVEEADAFAADPSDEHYQRIVDRLLQSPQFGEHWARMWLDLARYADTKGYEKDLPREIWRYRDWVIDALNQDLPYDQFTIRQLAGDLLPDATTDQILATAFHRNTMTNDEGGTDNEEFRLAAVKDRVDTTIQVWMGLTMGCAKCHSHKYDPISHREYYQFLAYFNQSEDADRSDDAPRIATPTSAQQQRQDELDRQLADLRKRYRMSSPERTEAMQLWAEQQAAQALWKTAQPQHVDAVQGSTLIIQPDRSILAKGQLPDRDTYVISLQVTGTSPVTAVRLEVLTDASLPRQGPGRYRQDPNFVLNEVSLKLVGQDSGVIRMLPLTSAESDFSQDGWDVTGAIDGKPDSGWAISPQQGQAHVAMFILAEPVTVAADQRLLIELTQQYAAAPLLMGRIRLSTSSQPVKSLKPELQSVAELAALTAEERSPEQQAALAEAWRQVAPETAPLWKQINELQAQRDELQKSIPRTPVMQDLPPDQHRITRIHNRGNFLDPGETVAPALPAAFTSSASAEPDRPVSNSGTRLDVARWLISDDNPLTARVMVNRVWGRLFSRGLVETEEDFGTQGALPDHPELLDWLAVEFRETQGWSLKQLCRSIVLSSTYRQSSDVTDQAREIDPDNRWLSRAPRFRLDAEAVRDQALAVAGLLSSKIGGPSVMPPQPDGIWRTTYSTLKWETPDDEDRFRRGIYTFLRRTSPYPSMITFDAGSREVCLIRRIPTNTPLQALVTMNDPVYLEAAGALAAECRTSAGNNPRELLSAMFRRVLIRPSTDREMDRLSAMYDQALAEFRSSTESTADLLQSAGLDQKAVESDQLPSLAAATIAASVLLNLDETVMRP